MRELSRKYNVPISTVSSRAKREGWQRTVEQITAKAEQKIVEKMSDARVSNADKAMNIINKLMDKMEKSIAVIKEGDVQSMKQLVGAMKDLRDMGVIDVGEKTQETINITISNDLEDFTK